MKTVLVMMVLVPTLGYAQCRVLFASALVAGVVGLAPVSHSQSIAELGLTISRSTRLTVNLGPLNTPYSQDVYIANGRIHVQHISSIKGMVTYEAALKDLHMGGVVRAKTSTPGVAFLGLSCQGEASCVQVTSSAGRSTSNSTSPGLAIYYDASQLQQLPYSMALLIAKSGGTN